MVSFLNDCSHFRLACQNPVTVRWAVTGSYSLRCGARTTRLNRLEVRSGRLLCFYGVLKPAVRRRYVLIRIAFSANDQLDSSCSIRPRRRRLSVPFLGSISLHSFARFSTIQFLESSRHRYVFCKLSILNYVTCRFLFLNMHSFG